MLARITTFSIDWKLSFFTLLLFPILIKLGLWQLDREQEKLTLQNMYSARQSAQPIPLIELSNYSEGIDLQYLRVEMSGEYINGKSFLLDNKINAGKVGFEVITPLVSKSNKLFFINRGWAPQGLYRTDLPNIEEILGEVELSATIYVPIGKQIILGEDEEFSTWPKLIQSIKLEKMHDQLENVKYTQLDSFPYILRLDEAVPGVLTRNWPVTSTKPEKHRGYAVQWFIMAAILLLLFGFACLKPESKKDEKDGP